ncbi:UNVERIFIED_CONTAM: hypothetical protein Sindi_2478300 [Sesamum indicum]
MPDCLEFKEDDISFTLARSAQQWAHHRHGLVDDEERVSYARILVEVDASKKLVDQVEFVMQNGVTRKQPIVYEFTPKFCTDCNRFGYHKSCQGNHAPIVLATTTPAATVKLAASKKVQPSEWTVVQ